MVDHTGELTDATTYVVEQSADSGGALDPTMEVVTSDTIPHDENTITIQVVNTDDNPVDLGAVRLPTIERTVLILSNSFHRLIT